MSSEKKDSSLGALISIMAAIIGIASGLITLAPYFPSLGKFLLGGFESASHIVADEAKSPSYMPSYSKPVGIDGKGKTGEKKAPSNMKIYGADGKAIGVIR